MRRSASRAAMPAMLRARRGVIQDDVGRPLRRVPETGLDTSKRTFVSSRAVAKQKKQKRDADPVTVLRFSEDHLWVRVEAERAQIGISDQGQDAHRRDHRASSCPTSATRSRRASRSASSSRCAPCRSWSRRSTAPCGAVNGELEDHPSLANEDPYHEGWLIEVELDDEDELDELMASEDYEEFVAGDRGVQRSRRRHARHVGATVCSPRHYSWRELRRSHAASDARRRRRRAAERQHGGRAARRRATSPTSACWRPWRAVPRHEFVPRPLARACLRRPAAADRRRSDDLATVRRRPDDAAAARCAAASASSRSAPARATRPPSSSRAGARGLLDRDRSRAGRRAPPSASPRWATATCTCAPATASSVGPRRRRSTPSSSPRPRRACPRRWSASCATAAASSLPLGNDEVQRLMVGDKNTARSHCGRWRTSCSCRCAASFISQTHARPKRRGTSKARFAGAGCYGSAFALAADEESASDVAVCACSDAARSRCASEPRTR